MGRPKTVQTVPFCPCCGGPKAPYYRPETALCRTCRTASITVADRFWSKVNKNGPLHNILKTPCWLWLTHVSVHGYGQFWMNGTTIPASRAVWLLTRGPIDNKLFVLHKCDNPPCVNPDHLFLGTAKDNFHDCMHKGRRDGCKGEGHYKAKLTWLQVRRIRELYSAGTCTRRQLEKAFNVTHNNLAFILNEETWKEPVSRAQT